MASREELIQFLARCDPGAPAGVEHYVDRKTAFGERIRVVLETSATAHVLVLGQTGIGKTTELANLERGVEAQFLFIRPPIDEDLDLSVVGALDLFVYAALWAGEEAQLTEDPHYKALEHALRPRVTLTEKDLVQGGFTSGGPPAPTGIQRFRNSHFAVRQTIALGPAQFLDLALALTREVEKVTKRQLVYVFDGLEKLGEDPARRMFDTELRIIATLPCRAVFTAPLALSFQRYFGDVLEAFTADVRLRAMPCDTGSLGFDFLMDVAHRREAGQVMSTELLKEAISWSGGLPRQLIQLLGAAATQAVTDGLTSIERETFHRARQRVSERWQYQLSHSDFSMLDADDTNRDPSDRSRLLRLGALVELEGPRGLMIELNPLLGPLLDTWRVEVGR